MSISNTLRKLEFTKPIWFSEHGRDCAENRVYCGLILAACETSDNLGDGPEHDFAVNGIPMKYVFKLDGYNDVYGFVMIHFEGKIFCMAEQLQLGYIACWASSREDEDEIWTILRMIA